MVIYFTGESPFEGTKIRLLVTIYTLYKRLLIQNFLAN